MVLYWWRYINKALFYGILLPPRKIHCRNFRNEWFGWCEGIEDTIEVEIGIRRELYDRETFFIVLVHEMVHQLQRAVGEPMSHKGLFKRWKPYVESLLGLPLRENV